MSFDWLLWLFLIIFFLVVLVYWPESFYVFWCQILHHGGDEDREDMDEVINDLFGPAVQEKDVASMNPKILVPEPNALDLRVPIAPTIGTVYNWIRPFCASITGSSSDHVLKICFTTHQIAYDFAHYYGSLCNRPFEVCGYFVRVPFWVEGAPHNPVYPDQEVLEEELI